MGTGGARLRTSPRPSRVDTIPLHPDCVALDYVRLVVGSPSVRVHQVIGCAVTDAIAAFPLAIPAGTTKASPVNLQCALGWSRVSQLLVTFPPGCSGFVGVRFLYSDNPVYPIGPSSFFVMDDFTLSIPITNQKQGGQWSMSGYNTDIYPHTVTGYFYFDYINAAQPASSSGLISL